MRNNLIFLFLAVTLVTLLNSCESDIKGFEFNNFENTPVSELAKAVKNNDVEEIKELVDRDKINIDFQDPVHQQTLLALAIVNRKEESFIELLNLGANTNILLGQSKNSSPLIESIKHQNNCDLFYIENLLQHNANPNLLIIPNDGKFFFDYYPLFVAIRKGVNGDECLDIIKILVQYGADINCCSPRPMVDGMCEGVINECIGMSCMDFLRYFIVEKKIRVPKVAYVIGGINESTQKAYTLTEILNTEDYQFEDYPEARDARNDILDYLKKTGQE